MSRFKDPKDPYAGIYGTNGIAASVDVTMAMIGADQGDNEVQLHIRGNHVPKEQLYLTMDNMNWKVIEDAKERQAELERQKIRNNVYYNAIKQAIREQESGCLSFTPSQLIRDANDREGCERLKFPKTLAKWIRQNLDFLEEEFAVTITEKKVTQGKAFIFTKQVKLPEAEKQADSQVVEMDDENHQNDSQNNSQEEEPELPFDLDTENAFTDNGGASLVEAEVRPDMGETEPEAADHNEYPFWDSDDLPPLTDEYIESLINGNEYDSGDDDGYQDDYDPWPITEEEWNYILEHAPQEETIPVEDYVPDDYLSDEGYQIANEAYLASLPHADTNTEPEDPVFDDPGAPSERILNEWIASGAEDNIF